MSITEREHPDLDLYGHLHRASSHRTKAGQLVVNVGQAIMRCSNGKRAWLSGKRDEWKLQTMEIRPERSERLTSLPKSQVSPWMTDYFTGGGEWKPF